MEAKKPISKTKLIVTIAVWVVVLGGIGYLGYLLSRVDQGKVTNVLRYEFAEAGQPESYDMENEYLSFSLDPFTTSFTLTQKSTGRVWYSSPVGAEEDTRALPKEKENMMSPFLLKYATESGLETQLDFHSYSVEKKVYEISQKGNEITVKYSVGDIEPVYWYPLCITEKDMEKWLEKMSSSDQRAVKNNYRLYQMGKWLPSDDKDKILSDYPMIEDGPVYVIKDDLQKHLKEKTQSIFEAAGYTYDDFLEDSENYAGGKVKNVPGFNVTVVYKLQGKNFIVEVPFNEIAYKTDFPITKLSILPYFGAATYEDQGFILVPQGGGNLINFNNGKTRQNAYYADVYGWDYATDRKAVITETRAAFPAFGIAYEDSSFVAIADKGAEYAGVNADVSGRLNSYNYAYFEYKMIHNEAFEATSQNQSSMYVYEKQLPDGEYISQIFTFVDSGSYVDMAKTYKEYLFGGKTAKTKNNGVPVAVEILGAVDKVQQVAGVPKTRPYKLTSYNEAGEIINSIEGLGIKNTYYKLSGFFNEGVRQKLLKKVKFINRLGGTSDFKKFAESNSDKKLYLDGTVQYSHRTGIFGGFNKYRDATRFASTKVAELSEYSPIYYGKYDANVRDPYFLVRPDLTQKMTDIFIKNATKYNLAGVSFREVGYQLSSDFNSKRVVSRAQSKDMQVAELKAAKEQGLGVMINAGNAYAVNDVDFITNLVMHGNDYAIFDKSVPFYQIALHGNVNFAGAAINLSPEINQGILEAAECGAGLFFTFMHDKERRLQETNYTEYYASNYENWEKRFGEIYKEYNANMADVIDSYIVDHQYVSDAVTVTEFENGKKVYVNFGYIDFTAEDGTKVPARTYKVAGGKK